MNRAMTQEELYRGEVGFDKGGPGVATRTSWSVGGTLISQTDNTFGVQATFGSDEVYTIMFAVVIPTARLAPINAVADIVWSTSGNSISRRVTIGNGTSISAPASAVSITVRDVSANPANPVEHIPYTVTVVVSKGVRAAKNTPPTLESGYSNALAAAVVVIPIPQGIGIISANVQVSNSPAAVIPDQGVLVQQFDAVSGAFLGGCDPRSFDWIPVSGSANQLTITNNTLVHQFYYVTWGIDG